MSTDKGEQLKINFDRDWRGCCLHATDNIDINDMINTNRCDDHYWISIQLPHIVVDKQQETNQTIANNEENWWYRKQFQWKTHRQNSDQRVYLIFELPNDHHINENNYHYSSVDTFMVWLNEIEIFSGSFQSPKTSVDLTEQLAYKDDSGSNNFKNTLVVCCTNASLSLHTYLLLPRVITHAIDQNNVDSSTERPSTTIPFRKNHVLDYLVNFNHDDGRFDIVFNPKLKSSTVSKQKNSPDIVISENHDQTNEQTVDNKENIEDLHVPRLAIVMLIVGTRGDVQPFVA